MEIKQNKLILGKGSLKLIMEKEPSCSFCGNLIVFDSICFVCPETDTVFHEACFERYGDKHINNILSVRSKEHKDICVQLQKK